MLADLAQIVVFPSFSGVRSRPSTTRSTWPSASRLTWLLGWHWAFLPSFLSELIPIWDLVPTWTAAVWYVTSGTLPPAAGRRARPSTSRPRPRPP
jgi:hypothetical protein